MRQYETFELRFQGKVLQRDWSGVDLTAEFVWGDRRRIVKGFYDGDGQYVVRFLPQASGVYTWRVTGAVTAQGFERCLPAEPGAHGLVRAVGTHFQYDDGTRYLPFGTTVYALAHQEDALVEETLESLHNAPFNKVRLCVFPKDYDYNHNEPPCYPFHRRQDGSWDCGRPEPVFWRRLEDILHRIGALGIQADLILFHPYDRWGFASLSQRDNLRYLDYLLRRFSAIPNLWWSLANEYDLCMGSKSLSDWEEIERAVAEHDPYGHLLSCHNCFALWDFSHPAVTHASIQTRALTEIPRWIHTWGKPVVIDECCYEGNLPHAWGNISGREMVRRFWRCCASGAYCTHGETFLSEDEVLWWAKGGKLKGESVERIAFLRWILERLPGPLEPLTQGWQKLTEMAPESIARAADAVPDWQKLFYRSAARMSDQNRWAQLAGEHIWAAHCGEDAYLWFNDQQCCAEQRISLPKDKRYRVELLDPWEMTVTPLADSVSGDITLRMPGREDLALLAVRVG